MDIQDIANHSAFIYKPPQEIHDKQISKYGFNNDCQKIGTNFFFGFLDWLYIKNTLGNSLETDQMLTINLAM